MTKINTNYNSPVPPERVYGQTIGGPSVERPKPTENTTRRVKQTQKGESGKGRYVDKYA